MWPFKCKHPAHRLGVFSPKPTIEPIDEDFEKVIFHLHCWGCGETLTVACANLIHGEDAFLNKQVTPPPR